MKWLLLIPAILVSSCSSPSNNKIENKQEEKTIVENLESKAKRQMMATIKELANNPSSVSISKFEKEFEFDSLYVAKFTMRAQNEFGGYSITDYEYIYMIKEDGIHDALVDLKVNPKIIMLAARAFNVASKKDKNADFTSSIKVAANSLVSFVGRKVPDRPVEEIKLINEWGKYLNNGINYNINNFCNCICNSS